MNFSNITKTLAIGALAATSANAADVDVLSNIAGSETWTSDNVYNLTTQIYVEDGATLTIEAGTVIRTEAEDGSLAVSRGGQIFVKGTQLEPVIMTSDEDVATWAADASHPTGKDPKSGTLRTSANEWGNLTLMGRGYISEDDVSGNVPTPNANNVAVMEGLVSGGGVPQSAILYGGGDDDDDSGSIQYLSIRYGGKNVALNKELNGLSLGGIGRETDISFVEIMNNVDDGIEIWGGTFNLKNFAIWNIGDDSLDIDQGYRGKVQFGLIVQGASLNAGQGSGVGDNAIETDGAENSDWQPRTRTTMYNLTVIGQPVAGDGLTAWRDNAGVQYRNCIFMDGGEKFVRFDDSDGDGAQGYGFNSTLSWADHWTTADTVFPAVNAPGNPGDFYGAQFGGNVCEITDSVMFRNLSPDAYTEATARGVFAAANNNVLEPSTQPIVSVTRGAPSVLGGLVILPVTGLDPRPAGDALTSASAAPADGFFTEANYRGAFEDSSSTWLCGWTASEAFGITSSTCNYYDLGCAKQGERGLPRLQGNGDFGSGLLGSLDLTAGPTSSLAILFVSLVETPVNFKGGVLKTVPILTSVGLATNPNGNVSLPIALPAGVPAGFEVFFQYGFSDVFATQGVGLSNAVVGITQ